MIDTALVVTMIAVPPVSAIVYLFLNSFEETPEPAPIDPERKEALRLAWEEIAEIEHREGL